MIHSKLISVQGVKLGVKLGVGLVFCFILHTDDQLTGLVPFVEKTYSSVEIAFATWSKVKLYRFILGLPIMFH